MQDNAAQRKYWNSASGAKWITFEDELDAVLAAVNDALIWRVRPRPGEHVLDIGCGTGATTRAFAPHLAPGGAITALDISKTLLTQAQSRGANQKIETRFCLCDAQSDAIPGAPFDIATSRFGVMFFADPVAAFTNIRRHLRAGGRVVFAAWAAMKGNPWFEVPGAAAVRRLGPVDPIEPNAPGPLGFQNIDHVVDILARAGFRDVGGEVADLTLHYPGKLRGMAALASQLGPAARILRHYDGTSEDVAAIEAMVLDGFRGFETAQGVDIPARINFFQARNPQ